MGDRRVWVPGPPRDAADPVPPSQLGGEDVALATARVRAGGWAIVSQAWPRSSNCTSVSSFTLPSPHPCALRVAALSTNVGWSPGTIVINADDFARAWGSQDTSAYSCSLHRGVSPTVVRHEARLALGHVRGLT